MWLSWLFSVVNTILAEPCIAYGSGKHPHNLPAHTFATSLGHDKSSALPMFHAITGCDRYSVIFRWTREKDSMGSMENVSRTDTSSQSTAASPADISEEHMAVIERLVILLYDRTNSFRSVSEARQKLFSKRSGTSPQHSSNQSGTC